MTSNQHCFSVPQHLLWKCQTSSFHLREILSDLHSLLSSAEAPVCTGPCFIWISKPVRRWPDTLNAIFWGITRGMWPLKCPWRRDLITETMLPLWLQGDGNLFLSALCFVDAMNTDVHLYLSERVFFRLPSRDGMQEIAHIFVHKHNSACAFNRIYELTPVACNTGPTVQRTHTISTA